MTNRGHVIFALLIGIFCVAPSFAAAQVVVTEIMYNVANGSDSGHEWVEIFNAGTVPVVITKLRLTENGTNHKLTASAGGGSLAPATYAVIADNAANFRADWPQYSGLLFDSAFSLSNDGETIALKDATSIVLDTASYTSGMGAAGDGNSLNRLPAQAGSTIDGSWVSRSPSPGFAMSNDVIPPKEKPVPPPKVPKVKAAKATTTAKVKKSYTTARTGSSVDLADDTGDSEVAAAATAFSGSQLEWYGAAGALILAAVAAIVFANRYAKNEWDIVEEKSE